MQTFPYVDLFQVERTNLTRNDSHKHVKSTAELPYPGVGSRRPFASLSSKDIPTPEKRKMPPIAKAVEESALGFKT